MRSLSSDPIVADRHLSVGLDPQRQLLLSASRGSRLSARRPGPSMRSRLRPLWLAARHIETLVVGGLTAGGLAMRLSRPPVIGLWAARLVSLPTSRLTSGSSPSDRLARQPHSA
jgi:hypothetical protein